MSRALLYLLLTLPVVVATTAGCKRDAPVDPPAAADRLQETVRPDLGRYFEAYDARGAFALFEPAGNRFARYDPDRCGQRFIPASTFKIFNTLVGLDTGVLSGPDHVIPWDGTERWNDAWNEDQDLATAFRRSTVPYFQEVARRVGEARMRTAMEREGYGNADPSGGIDTFWLTGGLRISPDEQVRFLHRLDAGSTGFSERARAILRRIMVLDSTETSVLRGKTGWAVDGDRQIGWLVGSVERPQGISYFALNLESTDPDFPMREARTAIADGILREFGLR